MGDYLHEIVTKPGCKSSLNFNHWEGEACRFKAAVYWEVSVELRTFTKVNLIGRVFHGGQLSRFPNAFKDFKDPPINRNILGFPEMNCVTLAVQGKIPTDANELEKVWGFEVGLPDEIVEQYTPWEEGGWADTVEELYKKGRMDDSNDPVEDEDSATSKAGDKKGGGDENVDDDADADDDAGDDDEDDEDDDYAQSSSEDGSVWSPSS
ncbi:hypothetical protein F5Y16DRAFT_401253 [Xylariaceae sp. FL0255]|nr:hypothetical protein F5Y16DRAFT_401253 [Xylariaceae sp. FL0255]